MSLRWRRLGGEQTKVALLALLPSFIVFCVFTVYPLFYSLYMSFFNVHLIASTRRFVGWANYVTLLNNPTFKKAIMNTVHYTIGVVPIGISLSLVVAVLLNNRLRLEGFFRSAFFAPVVTSMVAVSLVWTWMLEPNYGLLNSLLTRIGITGPGWLTDPSWAMTSVIIVSIWKNLGYNMVIFLAGLQDIPSEVYESAQIDGASSVQSFFRMTLPMMKPTIGFASIMSIMSSMKVFSQIYTMTGGGPANSTMVIVYYLYQQAFEFYRAGYASAVAWILFVIIMVFTVIQMRFFKTDY